MAFDKEHYSVWKLPHPMILHWVLNPGLAFNELVLGQRLPKITLIDKKSPAPLVQRQYVPCPECGALNDGRLWSGRNAFGHWFGYTCPECHGRIPCLWNLTSLVLLALTFPLWICFKAAAQRANRERAIARLSQAQSHDLARPPKIRWLAMGAGYGTLMFAIMVIPQVVQGQLSRGDVALQAAIFSVAGLAFGLFMKFFLGRKG